jgi:hypothetical protein
LLIRFQWELKSTKKPTVKGTVFEGNQKKVMKLVASLQHGLKQHKRFDHEGNTM